MMRRILAVFILLATVCSSVFANQEIDVELDNRDKRMYRHGVGYGDIIFEVLYTTGHNARVRIAVENLTQQPPYALLAFRRELDEPTLKRNKPKIEFEKIFPGEKGKRRVLRLGDTYRLCEIITPAETDTILTIDVPFATPSNLRFPLYIAKYKPKDLSKKGKYNINYKILEELVFDVTIKMEGWTREDPQFVKTKQEVEQFTASLEGVAFCPHRKHKPSLTEQQRPYRETQEKLQKSITEILENNRDWLKGDAPFDAYSELISKVKSIDLDSYKGLCPKHVGGGRVHQCGYCSMSTQQLYHQLDDTYQQLHAGRMSKEDAVRVAKAINNCYQQKKRKKDGFYGSKISGFYNRIINY